MRGFESCRMVMVSPSVIPMTFALNGSARTGREKSMAAVKARAATFIGHLGKVLENFFPGVEKQKPLDY